MSKLIELRETERMLQVKMERLEKLKHNPALQRELAFKDKLQTLMQQHGKSLGDIIALLDPPQWMADSHASARRKNR